jgi:hypothetical protein
MNWKQIVTGCSTICFQFIIGKATSVILGLWKSEQVSYFVESSAFCWLCVNIFMGVVRIPPNNSHARIMPVT